MKDEILKAIEICDSMIAFVNMADETDDSVIMSKSDRIRFFALSKGALYEKLERIENKPLTIDELREMIEMPVYIKFFNSMYKESFCTIIKRISEKFIYFDDGGKCELCDIYTEAQENQGDVIFYKYKPIEEIDYDN